ncbi:MAG: YihY/virulence factor BrkB family protein [Bryobacteraceae bacterium]|jgi:membrane protein
MARRTIRGLAEFEQNDIVKAITKVFSDWSDDRVPRLGASLAFYTLLSAAPLLLVVMAVAAAVYGRQAARGELVWEIRALVGIDGAKALQELLRNASQPGSGLFATAAGLLTASLGSTSVVVELRDALNTIWHVQAPEHPGFSGLLQSARERFFSFALILGGGVLLLLSVGLNATLAAMGKSFGSFLPSAPWILQAVTFLTSFLLVAFLFAAIYKFLPDVALNWSDVVVGALVTALLFEIGKLLIGLYLGRSAFGSAYGAAGSVVIFLVWLYYSAQIFFLGAEFTKTYTHSRIAAGKRSQKLF